MNLTVYRILVISAIITFYLYSCSQNGQDVQRVGEDRMEVTAGRLFGKYFGINVGAEDDFHIFQFNLYLTTDNKVKGTYYHICALFDPLPDETMYDHINNRKLIGPDIFKSVSHYIGHIIDGAKRDNKIYFRTDIRKHNSDYELQWEFEGKMDSSYLKGELIEFYKYIHVSGERYAYTTKKFIIFKKIDKP